MGNWLAKLPFGTVFFAALGILTLPIASPAQSQPGQDCRNDQNSNPCVEARLRRVRELYGVRSIEEHRAAGDQVRRVFYAGHSGYDLLLIAFVRPRGGDPIVSVHFPRRRGDGRAEPPLHAALPWTVWQNVLSRSVNFDREPGPPPPRAESRSVCLDGGTYLVETTDPIGSRGEPPTLRRAIEGDCEPGPARHYAMEIRTGCVAAFPLLRASRHQPISRPVLTASGVPHLSRRSDGRGRGVERRRGVPGDFRSSGRGSACPCLHRAVSDRLAR